jgi:hypothetical protein
MQKIVATRTGIGMIDRETETVALLAWVVRRMVWARLGLF